jgi:hypothetical protein
MSLSDARTRECLAVMEELLSYRISSMFSQPVDPDRDQCPTYFEVVSRPMDLGTVCNKLRNHEYESISVWQQDVHQVWDNAILFNGRNSMVAMLARQMQMVFRKLTEFITNDERSDWINKLADLRVTLTAVRGQAPKQLQPQKIVKVKEPPAGAKHPKPIRASSQTHKDHKKVPVVARPAVPTRSSSARVPPKQFSHEDIIKLRDDVMQLGEDEESMEKITDLIRKHEPQLMVGEEVEIELSRLKAETLGELRTLVDKLLAL